MKTFYILIALLCSICIGNCSFTQSQFPSTPLTPSISYNIKYGNHNDQKLDLCIPKELKQKSMIILIHGGAWCFGDKRSLNSTQELLASYGIASASINYRLNHGNISYKEQLADIDLAIKFIKERTANTKCNIILYGESAGAHLALLYGYRHSNSIAKIISLAPPTDFYSNNYLKNTFYHWYTKLFFELATGTKYATKNALKEFKKASPINQVANVPTLILQGTNDLIVDKSQAMSLAKVLSNKKIPHKLVLMKGGIHLSRYIAHWRERTIYPELLNFIQKKHIPRLQIAQQ